MFFEGSPNMKHSSNRVRRAAVGLLALGPLVGLAGCSGIEDQLLEPQQPGIITPEQIAAAGATGAQALYVGALGALQGWTGGGGNTNSQNLWVYADLMTDEWKVTDTFTQRIDLDRRQIATLDAEVTGRYNTAQQSRGRYRDALNALKANLPAEPEKQAEMYFAMGFEELNVSEMFCNGIPFGETVNGDPVYTTPLTNAEGFQLAVAHLDSAITLASGTSALAVKVKTAAQIAKARAQVNLGQFDAAAATVAGVSTAYQYLMTFSQPTQSNAIWTVNATANSARIAVGDSVTLANGVEVRIRNAIPFGSLNDPRVPIVSGSSYKNIAQTGFDGQTPWVGQRIWTARESPVVLVSGIDARLIEAEAKLQKNDIAGMMTILNALRAGNLSIGPITVGTIAPLATPTTQAAATDLFFREKALWQFGRGTRLGDLRRLIRQYGRTEDNTFPEDGFHKTPFKFGDDVNMPVPDAEKTNPNFKGCLDRKA
jgi:hypothetical protein